MRNQNNNSIFYNIDWITVLVYLVLMLMGWLNIYSAVYNEDHHVITDISQKYGKQMLWIATALVLALIILIISALVLALIILIIDENFYTVFAYFIFGTFLVANILVPFLGREVKGSRSWFRFGDFGIQPAEFMKFATNLALAKFLSNQNIKIADYKNTIISLLFLGVPLIIIAKLQDETGLAIVFAAFIFTLYREGLSVNYLLLGFLAVVLFILALLINNLYLFIIIGFLCAISVLFIKRNTKNLFIIAAIGLIACTMVKGTSYVYDHMEEHQKIRIDV
ncbi:MAG: rod shape-determining protein RodA, partial [Bacteroidia bacterium]